MPGGLTLLQAKSHAPSKRGDVNGDCRQWLGRLPERLELEKDLNSSRERRATFPVVKLVRAFGGCLGSKRR